MIFIIISGPYEFPLLFSGPAQNQGILSQGLEGKKIPVITEDKMVGWHP